MPTEDATSGRMGPASGRAGWPGTALASGVAGSVGSAIGPERAGQQARHFALDIMRELARAGLGEEHPVIGPQLADLAFEVRTLLQEAAGFIDKAVPDVDIGDAGLGGGVAIERIQEQHVGGALLAADRGQADPEHRHALGS